MHRRPIARVLTRALALATAAAAGAAAIGVAAPAAEAAEPSLIGADTTWSYLQDDTDPAPLPADPASWTTTSYDDDAWLEGLGGFGAKRGGNGLDVDGQPYVTELERLAPGSTDNVRTYFFRTTVTVDAKTLAVADQLVGDIVFDDAAVVYVNGQEAARLNAAGVTQNLQYWGTNGGRPVESTVTIDGGLLQEGENVVAVALYQDRETSSDIYLRFDSLVPTTVEPEISHVGLMVGADETERMVVWQSTTDEPQVAQVAPASTLVDGAMPADAQVATPEAGPSARGTVWHDATLTGLTPGEWAYRVGSDANGWTDVRTFTVQDVAGDWSFLAMGDAQIGSSGDRDADGIGWQQTLTTATAADPDAAFISSLGDQVESAGSTAEYDAYFQPEELRTNAFAVVNGNHDVGSSLYSEHFAHPNPTSLGQPITQTVGDFWYEMGGVLFLQLDANSTAYGEHEQFLRETIAAEGADADWVVVQFHHAIYSVANHSTSSATAERREALAPVFSELGVDLVLQGHDHSYARSYLMEGTEPLRPDVAAAAEPQPGAAIGDELRAEEGQVLYITLNSSSGSKYYTPKTAVAPYVAVFDQGRTPTYSVVDVAAGAITVTSYRTLDGVVVDEVTLTQDAVAPEIALPVDDAPIALGSAFDPMAGVTATDDEDGDLTAAIVVEGVVDTATAGTYALTYRVADAAGNEAVATRTIVVAEAVAPTDPPVEPASTDEPTPTGGPGPQAGDDVADVDGDLGGLPRTGVEPALAALLAALALLAAGIGVRAHARRRA
ncbi:immunoglobulin-like domain-containing protein [Agrococcus jejuensis]|uniref:Purple acid Phosphatase, N-terminal domain n=1 Tax=Agrococcus jejuensis TaxID=399736 RepID=A0A1G8F112_9MICO|nr:immunoglobulin-like domain-containing protein [Agrococcus jejuensis]SDH75828.1 Purple acid Phosphatase, N-terminal domain [Agrococcus jejuensis]